MSNLVIFLGGFSVSLVGLALIARSIWWDNLKKQPEGKAHALLLVPQVFRHLGLLGIVPEVVGEPLTKTTFAKTLAYGDALVAPLALLAMGLWLSGSKAARPFAWVFGIFASLDLANAIFGALTLPVTSYGIGAFWIVLTCLVPLVIVAQIMTFVKLATSGERGNFDRSARHAAASPRRVRIGAVRRPPRGVRKDRYSRDNWYDVLRALLEERGASIT